MVLRKGNLIKIELTNVNREDQTTLSNCLEPEHQVQTVHPIRYDSVELLPIRERVLNRTIDLKSY